MDIRGIEVTNQLRSAIRAKLLELGVRYDEELPDYILVMVVNKKTRQQMHEDLHLFLEDNTTPFVEWLHDQVLKKLQKVTIAKKKTSREFVPTVVVKQEEERKKRKNSAIAATEDQSVSINSVKLAPIVTKEEKTLSKIVERSAPIENPSLEVDSPNPPLAIEESEKIPTKPAISQATKATKATTSLQIREKALENVSEVKIVETHVKIATKRPLESVDDSGRPDKRVKPLSIDSDDVSEEEQVEREVEKETDTKDDKRLKSCINKPKITSVVSVKNRLGIVSPRKKFETHRVRDLGNRHRPTDKRFDKNLIDSDRFEKNLSDTNRFESLNRQTNLQRGKSFETEETSSQNRSNDLKNRQTPRANEERNRLGNPRDNGRFAKNSDTNKKIAIPRLKIVDKQVFTIKDRLGVNKNVGASKQSTVEECKTRSVRNTIKNRLGPFRYHVKVSNSHVGFVPLKKLGEKRVDDDTMNIEAEDDQDDDQSMINGGHIKSHVIALKRPQIIEKRLGKVAIDRKNNIEEEEDLDGGKSIASKVIVTPRPLKPLQPIQKRATQSLLLRAVAEANKSVVEQKNPEPVLMEKKRKLRCPKPPGAREIGKNLSVHLNATKRLVMEKIQVQLKTSEDNNKSKQYTPQPVNEEHMGVVMSLFQRSDDNQKFLVTLNGYNNNVITTKEKNLSDEEDERLEMEVTEDDELILSNVQNDKYEQNESLLTSTQIIGVDESDKVKAYENNENHNSENVETPEEAPQRKKRNLSPIVYSRTRSNSPAGNSNLAILSFGGKDTIEQKPVIEVPLSTVTDKSRDKCRYWPNCTLGSKCAYYHPAVLCGAFPACKFGDKCAYKHPKCKFGLSCTKLGCVFFHPKQQCKYHPFCTKPTCPYSHPSSHPVVPTEATRAKFTWKRHD